MAVWIGFEKYGTGILLGYLLRRNIWIRSERSDKFGADRRPKYESGLRATFSVAARGYDPITEESTICCFGGWNDLSLHRAPVADGDAC